MSSVTAENGASLPHIDEHKNKPVQREESPEKGGFNGSTESFGQDADGESSAVASVAFGGKMSDNEHDVQDPSEDPLSGGNPVDFNEIPEEKSGELPASDPSDSLPSSSSENIEIAENSKGKGGVTDSDSQESDEGQRKGKESSKSPVQPHQKDLVSAASDSSKSSKSSSLENIEIAEKSKAEDDAANSDSQKPGKGHLTDKESPKLPVQPHQKDILSAASDSSKSSSLENVEIAQKSKAEDDTANSDSQESDEGKRKGKESPKLPVQFHQKDLVSAASDSSKSSSLENIEKAESSKAKDDATNSDSQESGKGQLTDKESSKSPVQPHQKDLVSAASDSSKSSKSSSLENIEIAESSKTKIDVTNTDSQESGRGQRKDRRGIKSSMQSRRKSLVSFTSGSLEGSSSENSKSPEVSKFKGGISNDLKESNEGQEEDKEENKATAQPQRKALVSVMSGSLDSSSSENSKSPEFLLDKQSDTELPPRTFIPSSANTETGDSVPVTGVCASSLLEARQSEISVTFDAKDASSRQAISTGVESIKKTYRDIRNTIGHLPTELLGSDRIDWQLWDRVIDDYNDMVVHEETQLASAVAAGIPEEVRGIVWQLVARSKNLQLEELFMHLKTEPSIHEKAIKRDLTRTSFYTNIEAAKKAAELYSVILAYSNFDPDVGYTQGMVFIAVPLVMNMTESECFCLLVTLMKEYGLRELFCPEMRGLHLLLHQFDRLLEQHSPLLYNHLHRQGIRSSMYASQWFLTFFSYKFPFKVVLRIFDMVITQGVEAVLRLALNLMLKNEHRLMHLDFDGLLEFLKDSLFNVYVSDEFVAHEPQANRRFSLRSRKPAAKSAEYYKLDAFIQDSMKVDVSPLDLARWRAEFDQILLRDSRRENDIESLRAENGKLRSEIKQLEVEMYTLNHDHIEAVQNLVNVKVALPELVSDVDELRSEVTALESDIQNLELKLGANQENIPQDIEAQIHELLSQNAHETERFTNLEEELGKLSSQNEALEAELKKSKKWFWKK
ncbi:hypothetical protein JCM33374_g4441 [Metschnikowia sp. JCM 33374]|nr:hypothetical protein JCM33374_g4441 [Metschnikowia sp. JCM 33374]